MDHTCLLETWIIREFVANVTTKLVSIDTSVHTACFVPELLSGVLDGRSGEPDTLVMS